jgi:hypothetical protein
MEELSYILPAMKKLDPQNNIREVLFISPAFDDPAAGQQLEPMLREFDAAFAALPLPALKCVEIQVHKTRRNLPQHLIRRIEEVKPQAVPLIHQREAAALAARRTTAALLRDCLPILSSLRLLIVTEGEDP